jgi:hypothetical protein
MAKRVMVLPFASVTARRTVAQSRSAGKGFLPSAPCGDRQRRGETRAADSTARKTLKKNLALVEIIP